MTAVPFAKAAGLFQFPLHCILDYAIPHIFGCGYASRQPRAEVKIMKKVDFENGKILKNILQTAIPMLLAQVLSLLYSIVDRIYIGRIPGSGTQALGAVGLCFPIILIVAGFTNMFGMGGGPLFSIALGRGDREKADQLQNTALRLLVITAVLLTILTELFGGFMLRLFGASGSELPLTLPYLRIYIAGTVFQMVSAGMGPFIIAQGYSLISMASVAAGAVANLILDPVFIFGLGLGVEGAAAATVISQFLAAAVTMSFFLSRKNEFPLLPGRALPYAGEIMSLGLAPFIMQVTNSMVQIACNNVLMNFGGPDYVSIMTIVSSVRSILDTPVQAVTEGTSPIISYNYGARRPANVRRAIKIMAGIALIYTSSVWLVLFVRPQWFVRIFSSDPMLMHNCARALHLYFYAFVFQTLQYSGQTVFKALNKRKKAIFFSLFRKVILVVPLTYALPYLMGMGTDGVFLAEPISNVIGGTACFTTMLLTVLPELKEMENKPEKGKEDL